MRSIAYIIPGYKDARHNRKGYKTVAAFFRQRGARPVQVHIDWNRKERVFENFAAQFLKQYKKPKGTKTYVLGFSFGAVAALLAAPKAKPNALILCSLSPYFEEDLKRLRPDYLKWWRKATKNSDYPFRKVAPKVRARTIIVAGSKEGPEVMRRARAAKRVIKRNSLVIAKGAKHNISQKVYLAAIREIIAGL